MPGGREKTRQRRVALLIESTRAYARELILGIARFNQERTHWRVEFTPRGIDDSPPTWLKAWKGDGILARIDTSRMARALTEKKVPVVDLRRAVHREGLPQVGPDDAAVSEMVFEHFQQRGFRRFGFVSLPPGTHKAMDRRAEHFRELVEALGCAHHQLNVKAVTTGDRWEKMCRQIERWIKRIDRPCAIMTCNDDLGLQVLDACRRLGIRVPDEIAVAGVGNDVCLCDLALPGLTSVDLNPQRIGYEAAALLDRMMHGKTITDREALIAPARIVARQSTDVVAAEDPHVAEALVFIRDQACRGIQVADVLRQVHLSRAALEPRFKQAIGRTVHQEIQRIRLARVQELLTATDMPIKQIARLAGFRYPEYMMRIFRQATGQTLKQYRKGLKT
ncbi:substrate-binding domain-containing protein [Planctomycetales bacterium ZRK34]|nr:substrate-binding domain-containing protein [Planctomycetales bacterium ZRK34]